MPAEPVETKSTTLEEEDVSKTYTTPPLPEGYRFNVHATHGLVAVRIERSLVQDGTLDWRPTRLEAAVGEPESPKRVHQTMVTLANILHQQLSTRPLLGNYSPGDPV